MTFGTSGQSCLAAPIEAPDLCLYLIFSGLEWSRLLISEILLYALIVFSFKTGNLTDFYSIRAVGKKPDRRCCWRFATNSFNTLYKEYKYLFK